MSRIRKGRCAMATCAALMALLWGMAADGRDRLPRLTAEQWREDIRFLASQIARHHREPYHTITRAQFDDRVGALIGRVPDAEGDEIVVGLQSLAAAIGDGHTYLSASERYRRYPLRLFWYGTELRVVGATATSRAALGKRIVAWNGLPVTEAAARLQALIPQRESAWYNLGASADLFTQVEPLVALGIVPRSGRATLTLAHDDGTHFPLTIAPVAGQVLIDAAEQMPLHRSHTDEPFRFTYLPDDRTVYVNFRSFDRLERNAAALFSFINAHRVDRLVVDLRHNGGGNYTEGRKHLLYPLQFMPSLNRAGHLFVIIGRGTFSAGMTMATDFRRETEAILVGEPTGARPYGYQENHGFTLPNSKLPGSVAKLLYRFDSPEVEAVFPDHRVDPGWAADRAGGDAALDWILGQPAPDPDGGPARKGGVKPPAALPWADRPQRAIL